MYAAELLLDEVKDFFLKSKDSKAADALNSTQRKEECDRILANTSGDTAKTDLEKAQNITTFADISNYDNMKFILETVIGRLATSNHDTFLIYILQYMYNNCKPHANPWANGRSEKTIILNGVSEFVRRLYYANPIQLERSLRFRALVSNLLNGWDMTKQISLMLQSNGCLCLPTVSKRPPRLLMVSLLLGLRT